ncbi:MAG: RNase adapter RapZ [Clostridiales bacterium]|jgi:UPF0042 nucleotide-binding protein|nr:RNase adapter RapZ [Clostridiales bacterium]
MIRFVIITGMSGGGKSTALKMLEDVGYFCVDNLPIQLIEKFAEICFKADSGINKVALGIDVRTSTAFDELIVTIGELDKKGYRCELLFIDASDNVIVKRYKETRRKHPLVTDGRIEEGIQKERNLLQPLKETADYILETSNLLTRELKTELIKIFIDDEKYSGIYISVVSFGFKYGIPTDADLVFDVRFIPNPYYIPELRPLTGNDKEIQDYVMKWDISKTFLEKLEDMVKFLIPNYIEEGKTQLIVAIGCTGGKHRSVTLANELFLRLENESYSVKKEHRDIEKDVHK